MNIQPYHHELVKTKRPTWLTKGELCYNESESRDANEELSGIANFYDICPGGNYEYADRLGDFLVYIQFGRNALSGCPDDCLRLRDDKQFWSQITRAKCWPAFQNDGRHFDFLLPLPCYELYDSRKKRNTPYRYRNNRTALRIPS